MTRENNNEHQTIDMLKILIQTAQLRIKTSIMLYLLSSGACSSGFKNSACDQMPDLGATFCALCSLLLLRDDLSRVNTDGIAQLLQQLQSESGWWDMALTGINSYQLRMLRSYTITVRVWKIRKQFYAIFLTTCSNHIYNHIGTKSLCITISWNFEENMVSILFVNLYCLV